MEYKDSKCYKFFSEYDEAYEEQEVDTLIDMINCQVKGNATNMELVKLFTYLVGISCDEGSYEYNLRGVTIKGSTTTEYDGIGAGINWQTSSTNLHMYTGDKEQCEICYEVTEGNGSGSELTSFEVIPSEEVVMETDEELRSRIISTNTPLSLSCFLVAGKELDRYASITGLKRKGDKTVANLSKRKYTDEEARKNITDAARGLQLKHSFSVWVPKSTNTTGVDNMTVRTLNITLVDNNPNLKNKAKIVFQKMGFITEHSDDDAKMDLVATGKVKKALDSHNLKRTQTVDKAIQRATGRDVFLEEIELLSDPELQWQVVRIA